jgi:hypothetical protein
MIGLTRINFDIKNHTSQAHFTGQIVEDMIVSDFWPETLSGMVFALALAREEGIPCI